MIQFLAQGIDTPLGLLLLLLVTIAMLVTMIFL